MNKVVSLFLDRLAERFTALLAGVVSSRVEGLHAIAQAEQQSDLEDLARKYEAEGKPEIAITLRQRASGLTSSNLAAEALDVMQQVTGEPLRLSGPPTSDSPADLRGLPDFGQTPARGRNKRQRPVDGENINDAMGEPS